MQFTQHTAATHSYKSTNDASLHSNTNTDCHGNPAIFDTHSHNGSLLNSDLHTFTYPYAHRDGAFRTTF